MTSARPAIERAQALLQKIKKEVLCETDIIAFDQLPVCEPCKIDEYSERFGADRMESYMQFGQDTMKMAEKVRKLKLTEKNILAPITTTSVAITQCGMGTTVELCHRFCIDWLAAGCEEVINIIGVSGKEKYGLDGVSLYRHYFAIIGTLPSCWPIEISLSSFGELSDACVLVDPVLGVVVKAVDASKHLRILFKEYGINATTEVVGLVPETHAPMVPEIMKNAKTFSDLLKRELRLSAEEKMPARSTTTYGSPVHASGDAFADLCKDLTQALKLAKAEVAFDSVMKSVTARQFDQAIRRLSTGENVDNALPLLEIMMKYKDRLNMNINNPGSDGYTALHHAARKIAQHGDRALYDYLITQGARDDIQAKDGKTAANYLAASLAEWENKKNSMPAAVRKTG